MAECKIIRRKRRIVCLGDMRDLITVYLRNLTPPAGSSYDATSALSSLTAIKSMVETVTGTEVFDGANLKGVVTHHFYIRHSTAYAVDDQELIQWDGIAYRIIDAQDFEQRHEFILIRCSLAGNEDLATNTA